MKELVEYVARSAVGQPDAVNVEEVEGERRVVVRLEVASEDKGRVIGRQGRVAEATRMLLRASGVKQGKRVVLEIV